MINRDKKKKLSAYKYRDHFFKSPTKDQQCKPRRENSTITPRTSRYKDIFRYDAYGTPITKGGCHKVTFIDQVLKTNFAQIHVIQEEPKNCYITGKAIDTNFLFERRIKFDTNKQHQDIIDQQNAKCKACLIF